MQSFRLFPMHIPGVSTVPTALQFSEALHTTLAQAIVRTVPESQRLLRTAMVFTQRKRTLLSAFAGALSRRCARVVEEIATATEKYGEMEENCVVAECNLDQLLSRLTAQGQNKSVFETCIAELSAEEKSLVSEHLDLEDGIRVLPQKTQAVVEVTKTLTVRIKRSHKSLHRQSRKLHDRRLEVSALEGELAAITAELEPMRSQLRHLNTRQQTLRAAKEKAEAQVTQTRYQLQSRERQCAQMEQMLADLTSRKAPAENKCLVCLQRPFEVIFRPCLHVAACEKCAQGLETCPVCRARMKSRDRVYL